jgi:hypothetical protein
MCRLVIARIPDGSPKKQKTTLGCLKLALLRETCVDAALCSKYFHRSFEGNAYKTDFRK